MVSPPKLLYFIQL